MARRTVPTARYVSAQVGEPQRCVGDAEGARRTAHKPRPTNTQTYEAYEGRRTGPIPPLTLKGQGCSS